MNAPSRSPRTRSRVTGSFLLALFSLFLLESSLLTFPAAAATPREDLDAARAEAGAGNFDAALEILSGLLERSDAGDDVRREALILEGQCRVVFGDRGLAIEAFCEANRIGPPIYPNPSLFTQEEIEIINQVKEDPACGTPVPEPVPESRPLTKKPVFWAAGAGVVAVIVALALGGGNGNGNGNGAGGLDPDLTFPRPPD